MKVSGLSSALAGKASQVDLTSTNATIGFASQALIGVQTGLASLTDDVAAKASTISRSVLTNTVGIKAFTINVRDLSIIGDTETVM